MTKLAHVCLVALAGYALAGLVGTYFLVRFRRLHCVRQVQPWYCIAHYVCYGGFLAYFMSAGSMRRCRGSQDIGKRTASLWGASSQPLPRWTRTSAGASPPQLDWAQPASQSSSASRLWQVGVLLGQVVLDAFLRPWTEVVPEPPSPAAATRIVRLYGIYEPLLQAIAATAFFSSFALLCNARWRYAVMGTAEQHPGLWRAIVGVTTTTATAAALVGATDEVKKDGASILDGTGTYAAAVASLSPPMRRGSVVAPRILVQQSLAEQRRRSTCAPSYVNRARDRGDSTQGNLADSGVSTRISISTPGAEDVCGGGDLSATVRANQGKRATGGHEATAAAAASMDDVLVEDATLRGSRRKSWRRSLRPTRPQQQQNRTPSPINDDYDDIDDDDEKMWSSVEPGSSASHVTSSSPFRDNEGPSSTSSSRWCRPLRCSGRRLWPFSACECEEGQERTSRSGRAGDGGGGRSSREQHRHLRHLRQRLLAAFWLSDVVVVLLTFLMFALLAVARVAAATATASAWAAVEASTTQGSSGLERGRRGGQRLLTATAAVPCPTEGFVGVAGLLLLAAERVLVGRWMRLPGQLLAAAAASVATPAARQQQLRPRLPCRTWRRLGSSTFRGSLDLCHLPSTGRLHGMETAGSAAMSATAAAAVVSMTPVPFHLRHVLTVALLLLMLQFFSNAAWAWAAAVLLTTGSAVANLVDAVADPLRWVSTEYRRLLCRTWWELFFSFSFAPPSLESVNAQGQHVAGSMPAATPESLGGLGLPAAVGRELLVSRGNSIGMAVSATVMPPFGSRLRRHSIAHRSARLMKAGGGTGPLWMVRRLGASFAGAAVDSASSLPPPSAVTATAATVLGEGATSVVAGEDREDDGLLGGDAAGSHGVDGVGAAVATAISPMQFWHSVAAKVLQQSGRATGEAAELGSSSSRAIGGAEDVNGVGVVPTVATALLHPMPAVNPLAMLSPTPGMEHLSSAPARFTRENLKGSMLLTLPTVARVGGKAEAAELEMRERLLAMERAELRHEERAMRARRLSAADTMAAASTLSDESEEKLHAGNPPAHSAVPGVREHAGHHDDGDGALENAKEAQQQQSVTQDGWLSRALATVVPSFAATRCICEGDGVPISSPSTQLDSTSTVLNVSFNESLSLSSSTARAWIDEEEGFARFLDCVSRDGDNTYALQSLLAVYGHTYRHRVDAKGRSALHYAAMGGFVQGAIFLSRIGAEPNVLDKAGYAPLHYAVLYRTEVHTSPHITAESPSAAVQGARHVVGIPILETTAVQAAAQVTRRRRRDQQQRLEWVQAQLQAAYSAGSDASSGMDDRNSSGRSPQETARTKIARETSLRTRSDPSTASTPGKPLAVSPLQIFTPSSQRPLSSMRVGNAAAGSTSSAVRGPNPTAIPATTTAVPATTAAAAAAAAAVVVPEEGHWYGMVGALVRLGAQVDLPTAKGLTALHLAVMQGSVGIINTLLREGANPLLGLELETLSLASMINAASCWESDKENTEVLVKGAGKTAALCSSDGQTNDQAATHPTQQQQALSDTPQRTSNKGRDTTSLVSSKNDNSHTALGDASGPLATFTQHCEWVNMHITNAGNPIANGHCKSPLLLAVELDADLAVASMLHRVALQATTARVVAGLSQSIVAAPRMPERPPPAAPAAPPGAASLLAMVSMPHDSLASLPVAAASGGLPTSPAPRSRAFAASAAHPLADNGAGDAAMALPSPMSAAAAALSTSCSSTNVRRPGSRRMSPHTPGIADTSFSSSTTTTTAAAAAIPDSPSTRTWWERCCLHGFNPVHIALALGNAQVTRVLLLRWCYTEDVEHDRDAAAAPHKRVRKAEKLGGRARGLSLNEPRTTTTATPALPEGALATTTTTVPPLLSFQATAAPDVTDSTLLDFASGANISFHVDGLAAEQQQQQPVLAHVAAPLCEEADGCSQYTSVSGEAEAAPTGTLSLVPAAFWVRPLRLNLFHLAAVGDSTECLAYVLRWRGAPDYVPCALDDVFENEQRAESVRRESATATQGAYQRRRQQRRLRAYQSSQAACNPAGVAESLAVVAATTEPNLPNTEECVFPADAGSSSSSSSSGVPGVGHMMASGGGAAAAEAAPLLEKIVELDDVSRSPSSLPVAAATSEVVAGMEAALQRSLGPSSTDRSRTGTTEMAFKSDTDVIASSSSSDIFNHTWSSARLSAESNEAANTAAAPATPPRERRTRAKQQGFVRALVTLLQTNIRVDAVRRRVRKTVFGSSASRKTASPRRVNSRRQSSQRPRMDGGDDEDGDGSSDNTVMAKTCFGSISAAAALHTGMALCYANMGHPPRRRKRGECGSEKDADDSSSCSSSSSSSSSSNHENVKCRIVEAPGAPRELYRRATKGAERPRRLRQQRARAFVSAVAKLRHCIAGVPIDITHLAAVETAVDRACAQMASASARRALQQALLIVARRLQNQHRRAQLVTGLSCVAAAATAAMEAAAAQDDGQASRAESDDESTTITTTLATVEVSTGDVGGNRDSVSAGKSESLISSLSRSRQRDRAMEAPHHHHRRCSSPSCSSLDSPSALSYYSSLHSITTSTATTMRGSSPAAPDERASTSASDEEKPRRRKQHRQQSTLRLLRTLSTELNAVDTRGLTPLHYAIANQNASMVYLLCAYGATFVFASEQTEAHLMGHSAEVIAAAAAVEHHTDGCDTVTVVASDTQPAASQEELQSTTDPTDSMSQASSLPTAWAYARAQLSSPSINVSTDTLSSLGKRYYAQLTPPTQEALRRAAKTGSAEYLLWMPTQEDREAERQQRKLLSPLPVSEAREAARANPQRSVSPLAPHAVLSPAAPTATVMGAAAAERSSPANVQLRSTSPVMVPVSCLTAASPRPTTMAATLTAALGISDADGTTRATAAPPDAFPSAEEPLAKASMMTGGVKDDGGGGDALGPQLQTHLIRQEIRTLQSMIAGKDNGSVNGGSGEDLAACLRPPPQRLRTSPNADVSLDEAKDEATAAANLMAGRPFKQDVVRETPRQPNASSSSAPKTSAAMRTPATATSVGAEGASSTGVTELTQGARGAAVPPSSPSSNAAAAAVVYTLLEPHDVFITHVVRNPAKAESIMRAAMEGTALRYLFLASVVSGGSL